VSDVKFASLLAIREFDTDRKITVLEPKDFLGVPVEGHIKSLAAFARDKQRALSLLKIYSSFDYHSRGLSQSDLELVELLQDHYMRYSTSESYDARCISIAYKEVGLHSYDFGIAVASPEDQYNKHLGRNLAAIRLEDRSSPFCWHVDMKETDTERSVKIYSRSDDTLLFRDEVILPIEDLTYGTAECPNVRSITKAIYQTLSCLGDVPSSPFLFSWRDYERRNIEFRSYPHRSPDVRNPGFAKERSLW
jgi:hypothetical protein